jgi:hypothetical protein
MRLQTLRPPAVGTPPGSSDPTLILFVYVLRSVDLDFNDYLHFASATAGGQVWQPYLRANLWRDWGADANTVFSGTDVAPLESAATILELGGGLTARINANVSVFANADYEFAVDRTAATGEAAFEARLAPDILGETTVCVAAEPFHLIG